jgi:hypothetical protein
MTERSGYSRNLLTISRRAGRVNFYGSGCSDGAFRMTERASGSTSFAAAPPTRVKALKVF